MPQTEEGIVEVNRFELKPRDYSSAQTNLLLCTGIALGIEYATSGNFDSERTFLEHAVRLHSQIDDGVIREYVKALQMVINEKTS